MPKNVKTLSKAAEKAKMAKKEERNAAQRARHAARKAQKAAKIAGASAVTQDESANVASTAPTPYTEVKRVAFAHFIDANAFTQTAGGRRNVKRMRDALLGKKRTDRAVIFRNLTNHDMFFTDEQRAHLSGSKYYVVGFATVDSSNSTTLPGVAVFRAKPNKTKIDFVTRLDFENDPDGADHAFSMIVNEVLGLDKTWILMPITG